MRMFVLGLRSGILMRTALPFGSCLAVGCRWRQRGRAAAAPPGAAHRGREAKLRVGPGERQVKPPWKGVIQGLLRLPQRGCTVDSKKLEDGLVIISFPSSQVFGA